MEQMTKIVDEQQENMGCIRARHEALAKALGATDFQFIVMQDGIDFACHANFGNGMEPFYPDTPTSRFYQQG